MICVHFISFFKRVLVSIQIVSDMDAAITVYTLGFGFVIQCDMPVDNMTGKMLNLTPIPHLLLLIVETICFHVMFCCVTKQAADQQEKFFPCNPLIHTNPHIL